LASAVQHVARAHADESLTLDIARYRCWVDRLTAVFTPDFCARWRHVGQSSELPVFVVGMPRSGTTLTEQIIASHPQAGGAGELIRLIRFAQRYGYKKAPEKLEENLAALGRK